MSMSSFKIMLQQYVVEFLVVITVAAGGAFIAVAQAQAVQEQRVDDMDRRIEQLRQENRSDHEKIMSLLMDLVKKKGN